MLRQERTRAGNDGDVEAKKQAAERGSRSQKDDVANIDIAFHARIDVLGAKLIRMGNTKN